ncbi:MAG: TIM barrel protein [Pseudomonadota bacterium]|nr:TIM barrel protein [Pseudomonadota bacterium]
MTQFSANLGFLWSDRSLVDAIHAAHDAGFDAVECHWPYEHDPADVKAALDDTGLPMLGLNTPRGDVAAGDNGLAALSGRRDEARAAIDRAIAYAGAIRTPNIHVMAGFAEGMPAEACFIDNLRYATELAPDITFLIEPLNQHDAPGYFLNHTDQARRIIESVGAPNLKLMFDCYHIQILEGDLTRRLKANLDITGHIQFAGVPSRGRPDRGEIDYRHVFAHIAEMGYDAPLGAEYKPDSGDTDASLGWMTTLR